MTLRAAELENVFASILSTDFEMTQKLSTLLQMMRNLLASYVTHWSKNLT